jgi:hypothetical protein
MGKPAQSERIAGTEARKSAWRHANEQFAVGALG